MDRKNRPILPGLRRWEAERNGEFAEGSVSGGIEVSAIQYWLIPPHPGTHGPADPSIRGQREAAVMPRVGNSPTHDITGRG